MPLSEAAAGALSGIGSAIAGTAKGIIGNIMTGKREKKARQWNLDQWNRVNKYNTPLAQMQRLKDAKLNPYLIYGSSANTGQAGGIAPAKAAPVSEISGPLESLLMRSNIELLRKKVDTEHEVKVNLLLDGNRKDMENTILHDTMYDTIPGKKAEAQIKELELAIKEGSKQAIIDQAVALAKKTALTAEGVDKENKIKQFEVDLIKRFGLNKAFAALIMGRILSFAK